MSPQRLLLHKPGSSSRIASRTSRRPKNLPGLGTGLGSPIIGGPLLVNFPGFRLEIRVDLTFVPFLVMWCVIVTWYIRDLVRLTPTICWPCYSFLFGGGPTLPSPFSCMPRAGLAKTASFFPAQAGVQRQTGGLPQIVGFFFFLLRCYRNVYCFLN